MANKNQDSGNDILCTLLYNAISAVALTATWPSSFYAVRSFLAAAAAAQRIKLETLSFIIMTFYEYGILSFHSTRHTASLWHQHGLIQKRRYGCMLAEPGVYVRFPRNPKFRIGFSLVCLCSFSSSFSFCVPYSCACSFFLLLSLRVLCVWNVVFSYLSVNELPSWNSLW